MRTGNNRNQIMGHCFKGRKMAAIAAVRLISQKMAKLSLKDYALKLNPIYICAERTLHYIAYLATAVYDTVNKTYV